MESQIKKISLKVIPAIMNENTDIMKKISEIDLNLVERVLYHLNYEDLEKRVLYATYDMLRYFFSIENLLLKQENCESKRRTFSISPNGDGFWIVLVNGSGSENLRRSSDMTKVRITW